MGSIASFRQKSERYPVLRFVAVVCSLIGVLLIVLALALLGFGLAPLFQGQPIPFNGVALVPFAIWALGLFVGGIESLALGSFCRLAIHVEENTRATAQALDRLQGSLEPRLLLDPPPRFPS